MFQTKEIILPMFFMTFAVASKWQKCNGKCYYLGISKMTFADTDGYCKSMANHSKPVDFETKTELSLQTELPTCQLQKLDDQPYWIKKHDVKNRCWTLIFHGNVVQYKSTSCSSPSIPFCETYSTSFCQSSTISLAKDWIQVDGQDVLYKLSLRTYTYCDAQSHCVNNLSSQVARGGGYIFLGHLANALGLSGQQNLVFWLFSPGISCPQQQGNGSVVRYFGPFVHSEEAHSVNETFKVLCMKNITTTMSPSTYPTILPLETKSLIVNRTSTLSTVKNSQLKNLISHVSLQTTALTYMTSSAVLTKETQTNIASSTTLLTGTQTNMTSPTRTPAMTRSNISLHTSQPMTLQDGNTSFKIVASTKLLNFASRKPSSVTTQTRNKNLETSSALTLTNIISASTIPFTESTINTFVPSLTTKTSQQIQPHHVFGPSHSASLTSPSTTPPISTAMLSISTLKPFTQNPTALPASLAANMTTLSMNLSSQPTPNVTELRRNPTQLTSVLSIHQGNRSMTTSLQSQYVTKDPAARQSTSPWNASAPGPEWIRLGQEEYFVNYIPKNYIEAEWYCRRKLNASLVMFLSPIKYFTILSQIALQNSSFWVGAYGLNTTQKTDECLSYIVNNTTIGTLPCHMEKFSVCSHFLAGDISQVLEEPAFRNMIREMTVRKNETQKSVRKLTCAEDRRPSAQAAGGVGVFIICFVITLLLISDCSGIKSDFFKRKKNKKE